MTFLQTDPKERSSDSVPPWTRKDGVDIVDDVDDVVVGVVDIGVDVGVVGVTRDQDERKGNFAPSDQTSLDSFALDWVQLLRWVRASGSWTDASTRMKKGKGKERALN